jgi:tetratricopeptide (TPR) repeat protein
MIYTQQLRELLNELKLAKGKNCLIFAISERPARLKELIESNGFYVREIYLERKDNLLEMLLNWEETTENTIYVVRGIANQFPWVLPYINLHRDLFFDIKRPVVVVGSEYEVKEIQKRAPDWFRFRSRTYELKEEGKELGEERFIMPLAEPVYYSLFVEEEGEEEIKERMKLDEYLLSSERDDYKRAELYMSLSLSYFKLSDFERGEKYLQKSNDIRAKLKDNRGVLLNYERLSSIFILKRDFKKVIDTCNEALKIKPDLEVFYNNRGNAYSELNRLETAITDYNKAIELNPNYAEAYYNRGNAYRKLNLYTKVIEDYSKAIEKNPKFGIAYGNRGVTYAWLNQYEKAFEDYEKAIELNPNDAVAYNNRGLTYAKLNQSERAIEDYNKAIELNPDYAEAYNNRGNTYTEVNHYDKAFKDYDKAIELNPDFAVAYNNRGLTYAKLNQSERAIEDYNKAIDLNSDYAEAYNNRGNAYVKLNQYGRAIEDYDKAIKLNLDLADAYNNRGAAYADLNQYEQAIEDYDKAIKLNPDDAEAYGNRGLAYLNIGRYEESARDLKNAGLIFFHSGREEDAVKGFFICFELQDKIENDDIVYCGLTLFLITLNSDVIIALRKMQAQDETLRELLELAMRKLHNEDISEEIAVLEREEEREEMKILLERLKRF